MVSIPSWQARKISRPCRNAWRGSSPTDLANSLDCTSSLRSLAHRVKRQPFHEPLRFTASQEASRRARPLCCPGPERVQRWCCPVSRRLAGGVRTLTDWRVSCGATYRILRVPPIRRPVDRNLAGIAEDQTMGVALALEAIISPATPVIEANRPRLLIGILRALYRCSSCDPLS